MAETLIHSIETNDELQHQANVVEDMYVLSSWVGKGCIAAIAATAALGTASVLAGRVADEIEQAAPLVPDVEQFVFDIADFAHGQGALWANGAWSVALTSGVAWVGLNAVRYNWQSRLHKARFVESRQNAVINAVFGEVLDARTAA